MKPLHELGLSVTLCALVSAFLLAIAGNYLWAAMLLAVALVIGTRSADAIQDAEQRRREIDE